MTRSDPAAPLMPSPLHVFCSYAHEDERYRRRLHQALAPLRRRGLLADWSDRDIVPGETWQPAIAAALERADLILLLISPAFVASDYCYAREMARALERHGTGEALVLPIILRPTPGWQREAFAALQALPPEGKPVSTWRSRDMAWDTVVSGIERAITARMTGTPSMAPSIPLREQIQQRLHEAQREAWERQAGAPRDPLLTLDDMLAAEDALRDREGAAELTPLRHMQQRRREALDQQERDKAARQVYDNAMTDHMARFVAPAFLKVDVDRSIDDAAMADAIRHVADEDGLFPWWRLIQDEAVPDERTGEVYRRIVVRFQMAADQEPRDDEFYFRRDQAADGTITWTRMA